MLSGNDYNCLISLVCDVTDIYTDICNEDKFIVFIFSKQAQAISGQATYALSFFQFFSLELDF